MDIKRFFLNYFKRTQPHLSQVLDLLKSLAFRKKPTIWKHNSNQQMNEETNETRLRRAHHIIKMKFKLSLQTVLFVFRKEDYKFKVSSLLR